jgi:hypothetical protein
VPVLSEAGRPYNTGEVGRKAFLAFRARGRDRGLLWHRSPTVTRPLGSRKPTFPTADGSRHKYPSEGMGQVKE